MERYLGMTLDWDYEKHKVHISILDYIAEALIWFRHNAPQKPQDQPHPHIKSKYGEKVKYSKEEDYSPLQGKDEKNFIQ